MKYKFGYCCCCCFYFLPLSQNMFKFELFELVSNTENVENVSNVYTKTGLPTNKDKLPKRNSKLKNHIIKVFPKYRH